MAKQVLGFESKQSTQFLMVAGPRQPNESIHQDSSKGIDEQSLCVFTLNKCSVVYARVPGCHSTKLDLYQGW